MAQHAPASATSVPADPPLQPPLRRLVGKLQQGKRLSAWYDRHGWPVTPNSAAGRVYRALIASANEHAQAWPGVATLAERASRWTRRGCSTRTVRRALRDLEAQGLVVCVAGARGGQRGRHGITTTYWMPDAARLLQLFARWDERESADAPATTRSAAAEDSRELRRLRRRYLASDCRDLAAYRRILEIADRHRIETEVPEPWPTEADAASDTPADAAKQGGQSPADGRLLQTWSCPPRSPEESRPSRLTRTQDRTGAGAAPKKPPAARLGRTAALGDYFQAVTRPPTDTRRGSPASPT